MYPGPGFFSHAARGRQLRSSFWFVGCLSVFYKKKNYVRSFRKLRMVKTDSIVFSSFHPSIAQGVQGCI